jgi:mono/diheme cytochrome c family protein
MDQHRLFLIALVFFATFAPPAKTVTLPKSNNGKDANVTPVTGESLLTHLNRSLGDTSMGETWRLGPSPSTRGDSQQAVLPTLSQPTAETVTLRGSDLYRLNCQACHGQSGLGAPPEINSIVSPIRATSALLTRERMKKVGMGISNADAAKLAQEAETALLERLHKGGKTMPAFPQLTESDMRPLLAYLRLLADMPGAQDGQSAVKESRVRVGEFIVKSTCHICHGAIGPNPSAQELADGAIPPLSTLTTRKAESELIRKVTQGEPVLMGTPPMPYRGRMPVFYYLSAAEAADVYLYLAMYPPTESATPIPAVAVPPPHRWSSDQTGGSANARPLRQNMTNKETAMSISPRVELMLLLSSVLIVSLLLAGGLTVAIREFKRLSSHAVSYDIAARALDVKADMARPLGGNDSQCTSPWHIGSRGKKKR